MRTLLALFLAFAMCLPVGAQGFVFPVQYVAHTPLLASQLNTNFSAAATVLTSGGNGHLRIGNSSLTYTDALPTSTGGTITITPSSGGLNLETTGSAIIQHATVNISSANIPAMYATPVVLIAAPAAGKNIIVQKVEFTMTTTGTAYANGGAVHFQIANTAHGAGTDTAATVAAGIVTAGAGTSYAVQIPVSYVGTAATGLYISNDTAPFITGTGTAIVDVWYAVQ